MLGTRAGPPLAVAAALIAATPALAAPLTVIEHWGRFSETGSDFVTPHGVDAVEIERAADSLPWPSRPQEVWVLARTTFSARGPGQAGKSGERHQWADSRSCPALIPTLATLADLESVAIQPPGRPYPQGRDMGEVTAEQRRRPDGARESRLFDTSTYEIEAQGHWAAARWYGVVRMTGDAGSPASAWVNGAMRALEPCWSDKDPTR